jgi:peptidyl-prolyl cis-trans isomerase SurA
MDALISVLDTNKTVFSSKMSEKITPELAKNDLYAFNGKNYSIQNFVDSLSNNPEYNLTATTPDGLTAALKKILTSTVVTELTKDISSKYPLFNQLISEFEDGIILFKAEAANVWDKLSYDSLRAKKFYDTTKIDLTEPIRFDISEIYVLSQDKAREISEDIKNNKFSFDSAAFLFTQRQGYRDKQGHHGLVAITHKFGELAVKNNMKPGNVFGPFKQEEGYSNIKLNAVEPARKKTLQEALPIISAQVQSEYQKELESVWLKELRSTYKVEINNKLLKKAFKK